MQLVLLQACIDAPTVGLSTQHCTVRVYCRDCYAGYSISRRTMQLLHNKLFTREVATLTHLILHTGSCNQIYIWSISRRRGDCNYTIINSLRGKLQLLLIKHVMREAATKFTFGASLYVEQDAILTSKLLTSEVATLAN